MKAAEWDIYLVDEVRDSLDSATPSPSCKIRRSRGLTQQQVAEGMGVTKGRVSQIEQGKVSGQDVI